MLRRFKSLPTPLIKGSRDCELSFSWYRKEHLQMKIFLINVNVSYKRVTFAAFSLLFLCVLFLIYNQLNALGVFLYVGKLNTNKN